MVEVKARELRENSGWEMLSLEKALAYVERLPQPPSVDNFTCILQKCRRKKSLAFVHRLHAYMCRSGLESDSSLRNYLIPILVDVGSMSDAQQVFNRLVHRNEYSWTSLITGYAESGELQHALMLYQKMQEDCVHPSGFTFVALLKACARLKDANKGRAIHAEISRKGLERDLFVGSSLVNMYAKCAWLAEAQQVFDNLPLRNEVSWNALITGYAEHGFGEKGLSCFHQMKQEGISPNAVTFVGSLKACASIGAIDKGQEIHAEIAKKGLLERHLFLGNAVVDMYAKCGLVAKAREVFDKLPLRDAVSWNALIAGYAQHGLGEEALKCFERMQLDSVSPDAFTFACSLKACSSIGALDKGQELHSEIGRRGLLEKDPFLGNALVDMYAKCGLLAKVQEVFDKLPGRDVVSWTALMVAYVEHGLGEEALNCFEQMQLEGVPPNAVTFVCSLKACGSIGALDRGYELHAAISRIGLLETNPFVGSALVDMYAKCDSLAKAQEVFDKLSLRNEVSWNALISAYAEHGLGDKALNCYERMQLEGISPNAVTFVCSLKACGNLGAIDKGQELHSEIARKGLLESGPFIGNALVDMYAKCGLLANAQDVFDKLPVRNVVSWNALIAGYARHGLGEQALNCFEQIQLEGVSLDVLTFVCGLKACGSIGAVDKGQEIHAEIASQGLERDRLVGSTLVDMYAKCGFFAEAQKLFDEFPVRDVVTWTALIAGYAHLGESESVFHLLEGMRCKGIKPDGITFLSVLTVCNHTGLVDKGHTYFEAMSKVYGITPTIEHHACMVDLLGRAGQLDEAVAMMSKMPFHPNLVVWHTMLGACQKWGDVELGRHAFENAVQLDETNAGAYVLMSNIFVHSHMHGEMKKKVEALRVEVQAWKKSGQSWWDDVTGLMHSFLVEDKVIPKAEIY